MVSWNFSVKPQVPYTQGLEIARLFHRCFWNLYHLAKHYMLRSKKHLAIGLKNDGQIGVSVGVLHDALISSKKKTPGGDSWKAVFKKEIEIVANTLRKFEHENEFVWHEKILSGDELPSPQGRIKIAEMVSYKPKIWERELAFKL